MMLGNWRPGATSGVAIHTANLVKYFSHSNKILLCVVTFGPYSETPKIKNVNIRMLKTHKIYYLFPPLALVVLLIETIKIKPDLVHVQGTNLSPYLLFSLSFLKKTKKVITCHQSPSLEGVAQGRLKEGSLRLSLLRFMERLSAIKFDAVICVTRQLSEAISREYGPSLSKKIRVIPNGIDSDLFHPGYDEQLIRRKYNISPETFVIFHAKTFTINNGQEYLIRAMPKILDTKLKTKLLLAGNGPLRRAMEDLSSRLGVSDNVIFLGNVPHDQIAYYFAACNIVVIPSISSGEFEEGSSLFLLEAMAMQKPVVATNVGGLKESIIDSKTGILVPDKDPDAIADAVLRIMQDTDLRNSLGQEAKKFVESERSWVKVVNELEELYFQVARS